MLEQVTTTDRYAYNIRPDYFTPPACAGSYEVSELAYSDEKLLYSEQCRKNIGICVANHSKIILYYYEQSRPVRL